MGSLSVGNEVSIELDDDLLHHAFTVLLSKLRRREPVLLAWRNERGSVEEMLVNVGSVVRAEYTAGDPGPLDRVWLERIMIAANSMGGVCLSTAEAERPEHAIPTNPPTTYRQTTIARS